MMYEIIVVADTNDADYRTAVNKISAADLALIRPLIRAIGEFQPYKGKSPTSNYESMNRSNYPVGECRRDDLGEKSPEECYSEISPEIHELFQEFCPWEEHGFHTIESIHISPLVEREKLL